VDLRSPDLCSPGEATDAVLAEEFGSAAGQTNLLTRHAGWLNTLARRQTHRPDASGLDRAALAVDLLLADR